MFCQACSESKVFAKRLSADDTRRVRVYEDNPSKLGSRLDRANRGSTLNVVEFFLDAKRRHILIQLHRIFAF